MKLLVIGLDCAPPWLVFEQWRDELPTLRRLMVGRKRGRLAPGYQEGLRLYDVGPAVLNLFGLTPDADAVGRSRTAYQPDEAHG